MKTILISIHPKWCEKIFNGEKTIEVRKTAPQPPFKAIVYEPFNGGGRGKVIGEFICDKVDTISVHNDTVYSVGNLFADKLKNMCLTVAELKKYLGEKNNGYAIGIIAPKLYGEPKELGAFYSIKQCKPGYSPFGYQWTWEDRHKRKTGGWENEYRPVPIECHRCKSLVGGKDYLDEKSGCILFDYECISNYHKPLARPPQSYMRIQCTEED